MLNAKGKTPKLEKIKTGSKTNEKKKSIAILLL